MPNTIAFESTRKIPISSLSALEEPNPSRSTRRLGRSTRPSGGSFGSQPITSRDAAYVAASMPNVQGTPAVEMITPPSAGPATLASEL